MLLLLLAVGAACTPRGEESTPSGESSPTGGPLASSLQVEPGGDSVHLVFGVTNTSAEPVELNFSSGQSSDFVVLEGEREVWRWSADRFFTQALRSETLAPGETARYEASWTPPAGVRGPLTARAMLTDQAYRPDASVRFELP